MKKRGSPHLVLVDERTKRVTGQLTMACRGCGDEFTVLLPASLLMVPAVLKQWEREHRACRKWQEKARLELLRLLRSRV